jgi:hypothetical protein
MEAQQERKTHIVFFTKCVSMGFILERKNFMRDAPEVSKEWKKTGAIH